MQKHWGETMGTIQFKLGAKLVGLAAFMGLTGCTGDHGFQFSQAPKSAISDGGLGVVVTPSPTPSPTQGTIGDGSPNPTEPTDPNPNPSPSQSETHPDPNPTPLPSASASEDPDPEPEPTPTPTPAPTPSTSSTPPVVCDPNAIQIPAQYGLKASLYAGNANYANSSVQLIHSPITEKINADIFLANLSIPTVMFTSGFTTTGGAKLKDNQGTVLLEYFALDIKSQMALSQADQEGDYQIALLADDGVRLHIQENGDFTTLIDDDQVHPTRMSCASRVISFRQGQRIPFELTYFQGPRYHIALTMMWRRVERSSSASGLYESLCGKSGNGFFWNPNVTPSAPTDNFFQLIANGWKVMSPMNFVLEDGTRNVCSDSPEEDPILRFSP